MPTFNSRKYNRLFIGNVVPGDDQNKLKEKFECIGKLESWVYYKGDDFLYLEFENSVDADEAIKRFQGREFNGRYLVVEYSSKSTNLSILKKNNTRQNSLKKGLCYNCQEKGHIWSNCTWKKPEKQNEEEDRVEVVEIEEEEDEEEVIEEEAEEESDDVPISRRRHPSPKRDRDRPRERSREKHKNKHKSKARRRDNKG
jgi:RNA recognition motif-containing protein